MSHTIAAVSTGNQVSAIGILRLSGDDCIAVSDRVITLNNRKHLSDLPNRQLYLGTLRDSLGRAIDQCMVVVSRGPHSYTGEDTVEFHCHGSPAVLAAGLEALYLAGAKPAGRGEFTKRAFLNGQLDLTQAEAVIELFKHQFAQNLKPSETLKPSEPEIRVIGIRHGEKMYETLLTNEECAKAEDMGDFYRVPADNRSLNYDKFFTEGDEKRCELSEFNSDNTRRLTLEETKAKIASLEYIQNELKGIENIAK